ncbi:FimV family protein [Chitinilyticum litopenaei]|uniref:FimV family protein n=2 Tax=Chitinilyticum piscinae TaxID=2866724 RepID=A0A8J7K8K0_9NEIS|nr:FimV family protein [Chitinilyticum piscinae]
MNVLSSLGEPFRGQIEIVGVNAGEGDSLLVKLGSPEAHENAQLPYPGSMGLRFNVEKRKNGRYVVLVNSAQAVTEPFVDLIVELYWDGGNVKREFTALIDPPNYRAPAGATQTEPSYQTDVLPGVRSSGKVKRGKAKPAAEVAEQAAEAPQRASKPAAEPAVASGEGYTVKNGDTLSSIARRVQPEGVSLDQVLLALYRANPQAFEANNMNRLKRGKILNVPGAEEMKAVSAAEARSEIKVHTSNWQAYRAKLGEVAAKTPAVEAAPSASTGKITPKMEDKGATVPDAHKSELKLSKSDAKGSGAKDAKVKALEDEAVAKQKSLDDANKRVKELNKNVKDMEQYLSTKSKASVASAASAPAPAVVAAASLPASAVASAVAVASDASAVAVASMASVASEAASAPAPKPKRKPVPMPEPVEEPGIVDMLMENIVPVGGVLLALLAGAGGLIFMRRRQQRAPVFEDSIITGSDLKANTVLGSTGGGLISTQPTENSFLTDFSRQGLGTIDTDEVDPIAEADVYMAYGRYPQAEEILKDALAKDPQRAEIRLKLLEIYSANKDRAQFDVLAKELHEQTGGAGPLWDEAAKMGRAMSPDNSLYGAVAAVAAAGVAAVVADNVLAAPAAVEPAPAPLDPVVPPVAADVPAALEMPSADAADLDFSLDLPEPAELAAGLDLDVADALPDDGVMALDLPIDVAAAPAGDDLAMDFGELPELDMGEELSALDLDLGSAAAAPADLELPELAAESADAGLGLDFDFNLDAAAPVEAIEAVSTELGEETLSGFDLNFASDTDPATELDLASDDPVQTKIDLARAYIDMGDVEGAREILQEAMQEGNAEQKSVAQGMLSGI